MTHLEHGTCQSAGKIHSDKLIRFVQLLICQLRQVFYLKLRLVECGKAALASSRGRSLAVLVRAASPRGRGSLFSRAPLGQSLGAGDRPSASMRSLSRT